jgi:hypothetical protein
MGRATPDKVEQRRSKMSQKRFTHALLGLSAVGALVGGWATPSHAVTITELTPTFTIPWEFSLGGNTLTATVQFSDFDFNSPGTTTTLDLNLLVSNTTNAGINARFTAFGWDTTPVLASATETSTVYDSELNGQIASAHLDICFKAAGQNNCQGAGGGGLNEGQTDSFHLQLTFSQDNLTSVNFDNFFAKFQTDIGSIEGPPVPGPIVGAGLPGLVMACGGLLALARRRRQLA